VVVVAGSFGAATIAAFAAHFPAPAEMADIAALCAIWAALSPIPRLNPRIPWWMHWVEGAFILFGFLIPTRLAG
jgi:hypothetical protein